MSKWVALCIALLLVIISSTVSAQTEPSPDEATYIYAGSEILIVHNSEIVGSLELPEEAQNTVSGNSFIPYGLSPDLKYFVFAEEETFGENQFRATLNIADLEAQTCCTVVADPLENGTEVIGVGVFSPDNTQVVVTLNRAYFGPSESYTAIVELETGELAHVVNTQVVFDAPILRFVEWTEDGIVYEPFGCFPCGGGPSGIYMNWVPFEDEITETGVVVPMFGDRLDSTGEVLEAIRDEDLPVSNADAMVGPFNAIIATNDDRGETTVIYHDPDHLELGAPRWVMDGEAYFVHFWNEMISVVIDREGNVSEVEAGPATQFLAPTMDGWLAWNHEDSSLYTYHMDEDGVWVATNLGQYEMPVRVLRYPVIGLDAEAGIAVVQ